MTISHCLLEHGEDNGESEGEKDLGGDTLSPSPRCQHQSTHNDNMSYRKMIRLVC